MNHLRRFSTTLVGLAIALACATGVTHADTGSWAPVAPLPTPRAELAAVTGPDGRIYAIGASSTMVSFSYANEAYTPNCRFVLGFGTLHALISDSVGSCQENEQHNAVDGDALQLTTHGLLVWRKADNFTAFTDGYHSWVNGPYGLQERLNSQRFW